MGANYTDSPSLKKRYNKLLVRANKAWDYFNGGGHVENWPSFIKIVKDMDSLLNRISFYNTANILNGFNAG